MSDILMLIKTSELEFDDRLRKECLSLRRQGHSVAIVCSLASNRSEQGEVYGEVPFTSVHLRTRQRWPGNRFAVLHMLEFGWRVWRSGVLGRTVVWMHDPIALLLLPWLRLSRSRRLVWDHHELPPQRLLGSRVLSRLFGIFCNQADILIQANHPRLELFRQRTGYSGVGEVLNNFADDDFAGQPHQQLLPAEQDWLQGRRFVLLQSGGYPWRNFVPVIEAVMSEHWPAELRVILVGGAHQPTLRELEQRFPNLHQRVLQVGMVPQMQLARFVDNAVASLIFYREELLNQQLCEANRLYQAVSRGCPVVVGRNPPMRRIVEQTGAGLVLEDDGRCSAGICRAVTAIEADQGIASQARAAAGLFRWQAQDELIGRIAQAAVHG